MLGQITLADLSAAAYTATIAEERRTTPDYSHEEAARLAAAEVGQSDLEQLARAWLLTWLDHARLTRRWYGATEDLSFLPESSARAVVNRARDLWEELVHERDHTRATLGLDTLPPISGVTPKFDPDQLWVDRWLAG